jgi:hypothetical protein
LSKARQGKYLRYMIDYVLTVKVKFYNLKGRGNLEDLGVDGKIILEWILGIQGGNVCIG